MWPALFKIYFTSRVSLHRLAFGSQVKNPVEIVWTVKKSLKKRLAMNDTTIHVNTHNNQRKMDEENVKLDS